MPNNRQWALMCWIGVLLVWALSRADMRASLRNVLRAAASIKLIAPLAVFMVWVFGLILLGRVVGLWDNGLVTDAVFWFAGVGLALFGNFEKASKEPHFFRRKTRAAFGIVVALEVFSELFALNLLVEIFLVQPGFALLGGLSVVAAQQPEYRQVKKLVDVLIALGSMAILLHAAVSLAHDWSSVDKGHLLREFALPVWLTIGVLPYVYLVGLLAAYELAFIRIGWEPGVSRWARLQCKLALLTSLHLKAREVGTFSGSWQVRLRSAGSFRKARGVVREFHEAEREKVRAAAEEQARLARYAGVDGNDDDGRRLDRREFDETTTALRWLATCQMGWYNNQGGRYRPELLERFSDDFTRQGLPQPSGITMHVHPTDNAWYAWRRTVGGWVFAIGAGGPPPDQWEYDGPEPPAGFPGDDPAWGSTPFSQDANPNW